MSHFITIVIGDDPEGQLEPFNEGPPEGSEYLEFEENEEGKSEYEGKKGYWFNPNAKWDWYQLGGRWYGYLPLKEDGQGEFGKKSWTCKDKEPQPQTCDQTSLGNIDLDKMKTPIRYYKRRRVVSKRRNGLVGCGHK